MMPEIRITRSAAEQLDKLDYADAVEVQAAIEVLRSRKGEAVIGETIRLPGAPAGTTYLAMYGASKGRIWVIIFRPLLPGEGDGWLILSLLPGDEYRDMRRAAEVVASSPPVRDAVSALVAGTASTANVTAPPGSADTPTSGGAAPTTGSDVPR